MKEKTKSKLGKTHTDILKAAYAQASRISLQNRFDEIASHLTELEEFCLQMVIDNSEKSRAVLSVLITSLVHKIHNPNQDIRRHQDSMKGGYSGRGIDTKYITPFMKSQRFPSMSESGWLTRSLEQPLPYDSNYPGKITPKELKQAFLYILNQVEEQNKNAQTYLVFLLAKLIENRDKKSIDLAKPSNLPISTIIHFMKQHFESKYQSHGASRLPVLAIYSIYQCMIRELRRFEGQTLLPLEEHTSPDIRSGRIGDIEVRNDKGKVFEAVEIKHGIPIDSQHIRDAYEKFKSQPISRYYLLSTSGEDAGDTENIRMEIERIAKIHGCQVIVNGIYPSIKYYLRFLQNTYDFIEYYVENIKGDKALKYEHKQRWNEIVSQETIEE